MYLQIKTRINVSNIKYNIIKILFYIIKTYLKNKLF